jgi:hypothetical protein
MMTPWGMYMNAIRTGGLEIAWVDARESMKGRASESPAPFSQARRSSWKQSLTGLMVGSGCALFLNGSYPLILR